MDRGERATRGGDLFWTQDQRDLFCKGREQPGVTCDIRVSGLKPRADVEFPEKDLTRSGPLMNVVSPSSSLRFPHSNCSSALGMEFLKVTAGATMWPAGPALSAGAKGLGHRPSLWPRVLSLASPPSPGR